MGVYRPLYKDRKTGNTKRSRIWWYHFTFAGRHIQESSKSVRKTIAVEAEKKRHLELEKGFNNVVDTRRERIRSFQDMADEYLSNYKLRNPRSSTFAEYAIGHIKRVAGLSMSIDISHKTLEAYQSKRLKEMASPKSINEETGFFLRILGEQGEIIRAKMRRNSTLKLKSRQQLAKAFTPEQKTVMLAEAKKLRSPTIYPALTLALNCGLRDSELRSLKWGLINLEKGILTVGDSKTEAGEGRTIPLNSEATSALTDHAEWYCRKFGEIRPDWYVFPFGKPQPTDPTRPVVTLKTAWAKVKKASETTGRWHNNRHTFLTDLAESGEASDETIQDLAGHVSKRMLRHYSHIRMEAKRRAVEAIVNRQSSKRPIAERSGPSPQP